MTIQYLEKKLELVIHDGEDYCTAYNAITNYDGIATFNMKAEPIGTYDIFVEGDDVWGNSYIKVIEYPKAKTIVKAPKVTAYYKDNKYFKIVVKKNGKAIKNLKLNVKVYTGSKYKNFVIKTNKNGVAQLSTKKFQIGSHKVVVSSTNKNYKVSKASKIIIKKVKKKVHYVKIGIYKGKITNKQYNYIMNAYKKNKRYVNIFTKCINKKYHEMTVEILDGYSPMSDRTFERGFYGNVWDSRYGMDGTKLRYAKVKFYTNYV